MSVLVMLGIAFLLLLAVLHHIKRDNDSYLNPNGSLLFWAFVSVCSNYLFLNKLVINSSWIAGLLAMIVLFAAFVIVYTVILHKYIAKFILGFLIIANTAAIYFMQTYNVEIDKIMMINVFQTDVAEVGALISTKMLLFAGVDILLFYLLVKSNFVNKGWKQDLRRRLKLILQAGLLVAVILLPVAGKLGTFVEERKHLLYMMVPTNYISSTISVIKILKKHDKITPLNKKTEINRYWKDKTRKNILVVVVGESGRAANYSLNGYARDTNRHLKQFAKDIMVFKNATACGTSTAVSVPCMFSMLGRDNFIPGSASYLENVLDVFAYNDYKVIWRENNSSCKGNCTRITTEVFCQDNTCLDEVMQKDLKEKIRSIDDNIVLVLHQYGSHGPDYYLRYPKEFEIYKPVCESEILKDCSYEELVNAYDNSIVYNSYLAAEMLKDLSAFDDEYNIVVFYTSDHGESLGEDGFYMHSGVYDRSPAYQKEVPFWVWMPEKTKKNMNYSSVCLTNQTKRQASHDNLFHSMLGVAGLKIEAYNPELDIFAKCRN